MNYFLIHTQKGESVKFMTEWNGKEISHHLYSSKSSIKQSNIDKILDNDGSHNNSLTGQKVQDIGLVLAKRLSGSIGTDFKLWKSGKELRAIITIPINQEIN
jgi:hypothetical protein